MFFLSLIEDWKDQRDSSYRVAPLDLRKANGRWYLINPNRCNEIIVDPNNANKSQFKLFDNFKDRREGWSYVKADISVAEITAADDTPFHSNMITLDIYRKNDPTKATVATTMPVECIAWFKEYNPLPGYVWMCYVNGAFRRKEVLVGGTLQEIEDKLETGTTSTTSSTTTEERQ